jgi:hypothetical protein
MGSTPFLKDCRASRGGPGSEIYKCGQAMMAAKQSEVSDEVGWGKDQLKGGL